MAQSSETVFVIVENDLKPPLTGTLKDANGTLVYRAGKAVSVAVKPIAGGAEQVITADWLDSPSNNRPTLEWTSGNKLALGVYLGRFRTDPSGSERWSFPTEDPFTIVVTA